MAREFFEAGRGFATEMQKGNMSQAIQRYRIIVRKPIPPNLIEQVSALHAFALVRLRRETFAKLVGDGDYEVIEKVNSIENSALVSCSRNTS